MNTTTSYIGAVYNTYSDANREFTIASGTSYTDDNINKVLTFTVSGASKVSEIPYNTYSVDGSVITINSSYNMLCTRRQNYGL
jgi:hypothetical protein